MKCAMELTAIALNKAEEIAQEIALRKAQEKQKQLEYTTAFCEKLGVELEAVANRGKKPEVEFRCSNSYRVLKSTYSHYADHRLSYEFDGSTALDFEFMSAWFEHYCFEVKKREVYYWQYGWGECRGFDVVITPKPQCLE